MDAILLYRQDKGIDAQHRRAVELDRIISRLGEAIGKPEGIALVDLTRDHGRSFMQHMLKAKKVDGSPLSIGSARREANTVVAVVNHALTEFDITTKNPFANLPWPKDQQTSIDKRQPMPDELVSAVHARLHGARNPELPHIWTLLAATGARASEIVSLAHGDLMLDHAVPHIVIRPNEVKAGRKTQTSIRTVPLTPSAKTALEEALSLTGQAAKPSDPVFPRYSGDRGNDSISAILNKHITATAAKTSAPEGHTAYGLRHRVSDKLREAGAPVEVRHGFLGHALQEVAENTYGGREARLREFAKWAELAGL
jgi:integrase